MRISNKQYDEMVKKASPNSPIILDCIKAFLIGGAICCFGQLLFYIFRKSGMSLDESRSLVSISLIIITAILTGIGVFDKIAKHAGAGTIVPITGFANSVVSPAMEFKSEGFIMGTGASIFKVAGPVILYGTTAASLYGLIYFIVEKVINK
ncbi:MAG: stage V sporulation protein AC [Ruminococcaceae bacterium]|jgi:stage V sporulation protein AC|nr:stage V sporulation protein AC [Oscillospiraceae bacterium]